MSASGKQNLVFGFLATAFLAAAALLGGACTPTTEGELEVRSPEYFAMGSTAMGVDLRSPYTGSHIARIELIKQSETLTMAQITFEGFSITYLEPVHNPRCENLRDSVIRCVGSGDPSGDSGEVRFVSTLDGKRVLGFQIWEMAPSPTEIDRGEARSGDVFPRLIATIGEGADFVPPKAAGAAPSP